MNLSMLLFLLYLTSLCKAEEYDNYYYDDYNYDRNYDYNNQESEDYTADYNQELNDYYGHQNVLAPAPPPPFIPPTLPPRTGNYMLIMIRFMENNNYTYLLLQ